MISLIGIMRERPLIRKLASPILFLTAVLLPTLLYFSGNTYWWLIQLSLQIAICALGYWIPQWRLLALSTLILIIILNHTWFELDLDIPNACYQQIDELSGVTASDFQTDPTRLKLIKVEIWCKGNRVRWPLAEVNLSSNRPSKIRWYKLGDRLGLSKIQLEKAIFPSLKIKPGKKFVLYNISSQQKFFSRSAVFRYIQNKAVYYLDSDHAAIFKALVTADRSDLSEKRKTQFKELGIMHLFAISGMHIGILYLWCSLLIRFFISFPLSWIEKGHAIIIVDALSVTLIYFFLELIGMPLSASRALIMLTWWILAKHYFSWQPTWFILVGTALIILIQDPLALGQISFQLSFLSVAGILIVLPYLPKRKLQDRIQTIVLKTILSSAIISFWLFLLTFPIVDILIPDHSLISVVNNVIHIFFLSLIFVPILMLAVAITLLGYPVFGLPGEFYIFAFTNLTTKVWIQLLNWNDQWNQFFLWNPDWPWQLASTIFYWIFLILVLFSTVSLISFMQTKLRKMN